MKKEKKLHSRMLYSAAVLVFGVFTLGPILWSFIMSITPQSELVKDTTRLLPLHPTLDYYKELLSFGNQQGRLLVGGIYNSLKAVSISIVLGIPLSVLCAYPMSRLNFKGSVVIRNTLFFTMAIPVFATIIPLYRLYADMGLLDNMIALVFVYITSFLPLSVWLLMSYFDTLPRELEEAAYVDGCSRVKAMLLVILPMSWPVIFADVLIICLTIWNQFQIPLILAPSRATKPIAVVISEFVTKGGVEYGLMSASGILAIIPPAAIAVIFRRFLTKGIVGGSTNG